MFFSCLLCPQGESGLFFVHFVFLVVNDVETSNLINSSVWTPVKIIRGLLLGARVRGVRVYFTMMSVPSFLVSQSSVPPLRG